MKNPLPLIMSCLLLFVLNISDVLAQKEMKLNEDLARKSTPMLAKPKGIGTVTKYQFGPYKIVSGKEGLTKTTGKSRFFSVQSESKSKKKLSFVFVRDYKDSVVVNVLVENNSEWMADPIFKDVSLLKDGTENYMATFSLPTDTSTWAMMINNQVGLDVKGEDHFEGVLTDGNTVIQITEVDEWNDGKKGMVRGTIGYEFYAGGSSVAAVQASLDTFQKRIVWILQDIDPKLQLILAAASAAMMVRAQSTATE